jgi:hypothetical protein
VGVAPSRGEGDGSTDVPLPVSDCEPCLRRPPRVARDAGCGDRAPARLFGSTVRLCCRGAAPSRPVFWLPVGPSSGSRARTYKLETASSPCGVSKLGARPEKSAICRQDGNFCTPLDRVAAVTLATASPRFSFWLERKTRPAEPRRSRRPEHRLDRELHQRREGRANLAVTGHPDGTEKSLANAHAPARVALPCRRHAKLRPRPEATDSGFPWKSLTTEFTNPTGSSSSAGAARARRRDQAALIRPARRGPGDGERATLLAVS